MDIFSFFTLFGGLAFFLFGMNQMSQSLERVAGGKMQSILDKMTSNRFKGLLLGAIITVAIQSSSAVTVMLVGLVNSGIMDIANTAGVIMGSNIGTTVTAWIMSLIGVSSDNVFVRMMKPESFSPVLAFIGIIMIFMSKSERKKDTGTIFVGFAILMYGMELMSDSVAPLADSKKFASLLTAFNNPFLGVLTGTVITAVIQSSAASVGMLQALSMTGNITWNMAMPIIMGQNIGTCATAVISSIGVSRNAKRVSVIHISFNLIGTAIFMAAYFIIVKTIDLPFFEKAVTPVGIAAFHSIFNIVTTAILLPFSNGLVKIAKRVIRTESDTEKPFLDERLLNTPSVAAAECDERAKIMAEMTKQSVLEALDIVGSYDEKTADRIESLEQQCDEYQDHIFTFLVQLSGRDLSDHESLEVSKMLHTTDDFERMSDHALNIVNNARTMHDEGRAFSKESNEELLVLRKAIAEITKITFEAYDNMDLTKAKEVEPLEEVIDRLSEVTRLHHLERLKNGICTVDNGFTLNDYLTDLERISDHCSNIAVAVIELRNHSFDTHEYIDEHQDMSNERFRRQFEGFQKKYHLPDFPDALQGSETAALENGKSGVSA
ncbi:MAG: Na/Pi cotransporter family protein [Eubacteriales bacterium]|nr:Na/Pi cotransporter family protein [Eubacteriales bacterium]